MLQYIRQLFQKVFSKDWKKIISSWKWIYIYIKKYRVQVVIYTFLGIFISSFGLLASVVSKNLIDTVTGYDSGSIGWAAAAYAGLGLGQVFINIFTGRIRLTVETKVRQEIKFDVFNQVMRTDWKSMSEFTTGDLLMRTNGDASKIAGCVLNFLPNAVTTLFRFVGAFIIVCYHDPWMAVIALAGAPAIFITSNYRIANMRRFEKENMQLSSKNISFNQETFQNIQSIKAFNLTDLFAGKMKNIQKESFSLALKQYKYQSVSDIIMSVTGLLVGYACYGFAVFRLWQGDISFGTMTLFVSLAGTLTGSFDSVVQLIPTAIRAATSAERIKEIIDLPRENTEFIGEALEIREKSVTDGIYIKAENISFGYSSERRVYENGYFEAHSGDIIALVGPSGKGKTTTLKLLLGVLNPETGSICIGNTDGKKLDISPSTRCLFSYVPQEKTVFSGTVAENLRMVNPDAADSQIIEALKQACAWEFIEKLENGINTSVGERGLGFSEGQNQRISIARALLADAPVLLLDEATSALDMDTENRVLKNIIKKNPKRIIIVSSHRPSVFASCNHAYKIDEGKITWISDFSSEAWNKNPD